MSIVPLIILFNLLLQKSTATHFQNAAFFDDIRKNEKATAVYSEDGHVGRNLYRWNNTMDDHESILLCHLPTLLEYSDEMKTPSRCMISYSASAAALLAIHHFNNGDGSIVPELLHINKKCNLRLTTEMLDSGSSPFNAVRVLTEVVTRPADSFAKPQPCAVLGSEFSTVTSRMATLSGVFDLFQVSSSALSSELDNLKQYPLFARSHTVSMKAILDICRNFYTRSLAQRFDTTSFFSGRRRFWRDVYILFTKQECEYILHSGT